MHTKFTEIARFSVIQEKGSEDMLVYFVPTLNQFDGKPMTSTRIYELQREINDYAKDLMFGGVKMTLVQSDEVVIDFVLDVYLNINTSDTASVKEAIVTVLEDFFDRTKQPRNFYFRRGYAITAIESGVDEIYSVDLTYPVVDRQAKDNELFVLGNVVARFIQKNDFDDWD